MRLVHWFSLVTLIMGLVLLLMELSTAGGVMFVIATVVELLHSALSGKQTNDGTH